MDSDERDPIEALAKAMYRDTHGTDPEFVWEDCPEPVSRLYRSNARAVVAALAPDLSFARDAIQDEVGLWRFDADGVANDGAREMYPEHIAVYERLAALLAACRAPEPATGNHSPSVASDTLDADPPGEGG